jgi:hypothetical protein
MTDAQQTSNKAKRERIFRAFMSLSRQGMGAEEARRTIAADLGVNVEVIVASINRTLVGR